MAAKSIGIIFCLCFLQTNFAIASEDTLRLDIKTAEKMFLDKNLLLLAEHYNIQSSQALVTQARKWDNPLLVTDQNIYRKDEGFFKHGETVSGAPQGQYFVQLQQLIKTAGKRGKQIKLAKTNVSLAEWQFQTVMRELRFALFKDFYSIIQLQGNAELYKENEEQLNKLLKGMQAQLQAGNIARKEYLRIQALMLGLQQDMAENAKNLNDAEAELKTLLQIGDNTFLKPEAPEGIRATLPQMSIERLTDSARLHNPDYQTEVYQAQYQKQNLSLQKAMAVPDITLGPEFDQNSNYAPNYYGLSISLPLPIWDRNQGNIRSARYHVKEEDARLQNAAIKLQNDVMNAYKKLVLSVNLNSGQNVQFYSDYYQLYRNIVESYDKRQISLLEFLDNFNAYADTREKELKQNLNLQLAKLELNDVVGVDVVE